MDTSVDNSTLVDSNLLTIVENSDLSLTDSLLEGRSLLPLNDIQPEIPIKYLDSGIQHNGISQFDEDNEVDLPSFDRENASVNGETRTISILSQDSSSSPNKLTRRQETILRLEMRRKYEEEQLTFHPKLKSSRRNSGSSEQFSPTDAGGSNRFDRLYNEARKRQESRTESVTNENFTFKPEISRRARSTERTASVEDRTNRLYNGVGAGRRNSLNEKEGSTNGKDKGSFQPKITKRAKSIERTESVDDRLYSRAIIYQEKHNQLKAAIIKREEELCPFQPKLNKNRSSSAQKEHENSRRLEVGDRMQRYLEDRQRRLEEAKRAKKEQEDVHAPFKPTLVTKKSISKELNSDVFARLAAAAEKEPKPVFIDESELTFKPQINTRRSLTPTKSEFTSVHERLHKIGELRKKERDVERQVAREEEEKDLTFTPQMITKKNFDLVDRVPVFERLSLSRQYVQEILTQIKSEYELTDCTFHPEINALTQKAAEARNVGNTPVHVRLNTEAERLKALAKKREEDIKERELDGCTFSPQLPRVTTNLKTDGDVFTRLANTTTASLSAGLPTPLQSSFSQPPPSSTGSTSEAGTPPRKSMQQSPLRNSTFKKDSSFKSDTTTAGVTPILKKSNSESVPSGSAVIPKSFATATTPKSSSLLSSSFDSNNSSSNSSSPRPASHHSHSLSSPGLSTSSSKSGSNTTSNSYLKPTSASKAKKAFYSKSELNGLDKPTTTTTSSSTSSSSTHHSHPTTTPSNPTKLSNGLHTPLLEKPKDKKQQPPVPQHHLPSPPPSQNGQQQESDKQHQEEIQDNSSQNIISGITYMEMETPLSPPLPPSTDGLSQEEVALVSSVENSVNEILVSEGEL